MTEKSNGENDQSVADAESGIQSDSDSGADDALFDDLDIAAESATTSARPPRSPLLLAAAALLLSLAALAGSAYLLLFSGNDGATAEATAQQIASLSTALRNNESKIAALERELAGIGEGGDAPAVDIDAIERRLQTRLQDRLQLLESVPARVASLEIALSALRGISTGARDAWLLAEAEYYLQIGNAQLQLAGNPLLAALALKLADERIVELGDPGLTDVRRVLADEIRSLEVLEMPDIEGATLTLASLSRVVDSLPLQQRIVLLNDVPSEPDAELSGTDRALASLKSAMSGVVSVRRTDEAARPLIAPEAVYFLRANLALQLQAARLALLRGEQALFQQSLDDAASWLREYYDTESAPVRSTLQTISEIRQGAFTRAMPDVSGSLRLIREYIAFIEAARIESAGAESGPQQ
jgi:uroporphyrin-3 C-methyltransferase